MKPPENIQTIKGEIADYWYNDGILYAYSKTVLRTVENIPEMLHWLSK